MDLKLFIFVVEVLGGAFHVCETKESVQNSLSSMQMGFPKKVWRRGCPPIHKNIKKLLLFAVFGNL